MSTNVFFKMSLKGGTSASQTTVLFCSTKQWTFPKGLWHIWTYQHSRLPPIPPPFFHSRVSQTLEGSGSTVNTLTRQLIDTPFSLEDIWSGFTVEDDNSRDLWRKETSSICSTEKFVSEEWPSSRSRQALVFWWLALAYNCETWSVMCLHVLKCGLGPGIDGLLLEDWKTVSVWFSDQRRQNSVLLVHFSGK